MADDKELEGIVQRMIDAGESEENIATVIKEYDTVSPLASHESSTPISEVVPPAVLALSAVRPTTKYLAEKVAAGKTAPILRLAGRVIGGTAGAAAAGGGTLGIGSFGGAAVGGYAGGEVMRKTQPYVKSAAKSLLAAADTAKPLPVRGAMGRMIPGAMPAGRKMFDAFSHAIPGIGNASIISMLLDQQGDGAGLPHDGRSQQNAEIEYRRIHPTGSDIELPPDGPDIPNDVRAMLMQEMLNRSR